MTEKAAVSSVHAPATVVANTSAQVKGWLREVWDADVSDPRALKINPYDVVIEFTRCPADKPDLAAKVAEASKVLRERLEVSGFVVSLKVKQYPNTKPGTAAAHTTHLKVTAPETALYSLARQLGIRKRLRDGGVMETFSHEHVHEYERESNQQLFTPQERKKMVLYKIQSLSCILEEEKIAGVTMNKNRPIVHRLSKKGIIASVYPLHDVSARNQLSQSWLRGSWLSLSLPLKSLRDYFGEEIALYFAWLGFYTRWLAVPALCGLAVWLLQGELTIVWTTLFCEGWKRHSATVVYEWGLWGFEKEETARPAFKGVWVTDEVTGVRVLREKNPKVKYVKYLVSVPVIGCMLSLVVFGMLFFFWLEERMGSAHSTWIAVVLYGAFIPLLSFLYRKVAVLLNDWENHRTQSQYEQKLVLKLVLFEFFNCFLLLFWTAFYQQDFVLLRSYLMTLLFSRQLTNNMLEALLPWYKVKAKVVMQRRKQDAALRAGKKEDLSASLSGSTPTEHAQLSQYEVEGMMDVYEDTFDDYLEMIVQFGYMTFFASAFPLAPLFAMLNNVIEIRSDGFKLLHASQRAKPQCLEVISIASILTNLCLIMYTSPQFDSYFSDPVVKVWVVVLLEHLLIGGRYILAVLIPDVPHSVAHGLRVQAHLAEQRKVAELRESIRRSQ